MRTTILCALLGASAAFGQSFVVSPLLYERHEAASSNSFPFTNAFRYQQVHGDLKGTPRVFQGVAWRRDGAQVTNTTHVARTFDLEARLADGNLASFAGTFASNYVGTPVQVFLRKNVNAPDWTQQPAASPAPWNLSLLFDVPFVYSGTNDLLYEVVIHATSATTAYLADSALGTSTTVTGGSQAHGTGCTTINGVMRLRANEINNSGTGNLTAQWVVASAPSAAATTVLIGLTNPALPIPFGCGSSTLFTDAAITSYSGASTNPGGFTTTPQLAVAWNPAYAGFLMTAQAASIDPSQGGLGIALSIGVTSEAPPTVSPVLVSKLVANGSPTATTGTATANTGLVTRFQH